MDRYITEEIDEFPEEMMKIINMPGGNHLFKVDNAFVKLCERELRSFSIGWWQS